MMRTAHLWATAAIAQAVASCASASETPRARAIVVRFALANEFATTATGAGSLEECFPNAPLGCGVAGDQAPWVFDPVVAFVRARLVGDGREHARRHVSARIVHDDRWDVSAEPAGAGTAILVDPRTELGRVTVLDYDGFSVFAATVYCTHVVRNAGPLEVVLEQRLSLIY